MRAWRRRAGGLAVALSVISLIRPLPGRADAEIRVVSFNICGAICNQGRVGGLVDHVRDVLVGHRAHLAVLNEICWPQYQRLRKLLADSAHRMEGSFHAQREDRRCPGGFGDAVLTRGAAGRAEVIRLPNRGERRSILCVPTHVHRRVTVCGLHLTAGNRELNARQWRKVVEWAGRLMRDTDLVLAGDFNRDPPQMGALRSSTHDAGAGGDEDTHGNRRIDFVLFERDAFGWAWADVRGSRFSDHRIVLARAGPGR